MSLAICRSRQFPVSLGRSGLIRLAAGQSPVCAAPGERMLHPGTTSQFLAARRRGLLRGMELLPNEPQSVAFQQLQQGREHVVLARRRRLDADKAAEHLRKVLVPIAFAKRLMSRLRLHPFPLEISHAPILLACPHSTGTFSNEFDSWHGPGPPGRRPATRRSSIS